MTSRSDAHGRRRLVAGRMTTGALMVGLLMGVGAPLAVADPTAPADPSAAAAEPAAQQMTADEALMIISNEYDTGAGGGQISQLIHSIMKLRAQGYRPSNSNREAIVAALDKRPNQAPLIDALKNTVAYQRKLQARTSAQVPQQNGLIPGIGQFPGGIAPIPGGPNAGIQIPLG